MIPHANDITKDISMIAPFRICDGKLIAFGLVLIVDVLSNRLCSLKRELGSKSKTSEAAFVKMFSFGIGRDSSSRRDGDIQRPAIVRDALWNDIESRAYRSSARQRSASPDVRGLLA